MPEAAQSTLDDAPNSAETDLALQKRLRWQCRRGMLEMDFLLRRYIDTAFLSSTPEAKVSFEALLQLEDDVLWDYLLGIKTPSELDFQQLLIAIRSGYAA